MGVPQAQPRLCRPPRPLGSGSSCAKRDPRPHERGNNTRVSGAHSGVGHTPLCSSHGRDSGRPGLGLCSRSCPGQTAPLPHPPRPPSRSLNIWRKDHPRGLLAMRRVKEQHREPPEPSPGQTGPGRVNRGARGRARGGGSVRDRGAGEEAGCSPAGPLLPSQRDTVPWGPTSGRETLALCVPMKISL